MSDGVIKIDTRIDQTGIDKGTKEIKDKLSSVGESMSNVGDSLNKYVTLPLVAVGAGALKVASDFDASQAKIQNSLGLTASEAELLNDTVSNVWKDGFGASLDEVTNSLLEVKQNMSNLDDGELETATKNAMTLAQTFDSDVNEVTRAGNNLMKNFGLESGTAFDLMAFGAQNGLNFSKEMFDNLAEYSPLFADMGYSAEEMFGILMRGADAGVYNFDYLNDVMKEFGIRIADSSKSTSDAMDGMSKGTQKLFEEFEKGKVSSADMATAISNDLAKMDSDVKRNEYGVALFGTKWEDLGGDVVLSMLASEQAISGFEGSMSGMVATQEQTFGQRFQSMLRELGAALLPLGEVLMNMASAVMPHLASAVQAVSQWFSNLSPSIQKAVTIFGMIAAALGPVIMVLGIVVGAVSNLVGPIMKVVGWFGKLAPVFNGLKIGLAALSGPVGIVVAVIGLLVAAGIALYKNWGTVSAFLSETWASIAEFGVSVWQGFTDWITSLWTSTVELASSIWGSITEFFSNLWTGIVEGATTAWEGLKSTVAAIWQGIVDAVMVAVAPLVQGVMNYFNSMKDGVSQIFEGFKLYFQSAWDFIKNVFLGALLLLLDLVTGDFESMKSHAIQIWENLKEALNGIWQGIMLVFSGTLEAIKGFITTAWDHIKTNTTNSFNTVKSFLTNTWSAIKSAVETTVETIKNTVRDKFEALKAAVTEKMNSAKETISKIWSEIKAVSANLPEQIKNTVKEKFEALKNAVQEKMNGVKTKITEIWNEAQSFLENIDLLQVGKDIINGLITGISSMGKEVWGAVKGIAKGIKDSITAELKIESPSRWMRDYVVGNMFKGFEVGVDKQASNFAHTSKDMASMMMPKAEQVAGHTGMYKQASFGSYAQQMLNVVMQIDSQTMGRILTPVVAERITLKVGR